jgi:hypothetical protein
LPPNNIIPSVEAINAAWISKLMGRAIAKVTTTPVGTGQVGATYRFSLTHDGPEAASLIGKFVSADPISRATGIAQSSYLREVNFYATLRPHRSIPSPHCYFAKIDASTHEFALILTDYPDHCAGNQLQPATLEEAQLAVIAGAQIHAPWWGDESLDAYPWLNGSRAIAPMDVDGLYTLLWPAFCDRYKDRIDQTIKSAGEAYLGKINTWISRRTGPRCLTHGDFRPDNMLFNSDDAGNPIIIVDWQTAGVGTGATDIAYYLGTALAPDVRRRHERALFDLWVEALVARGVDRADTQGLWNCYCRDGVAGFLMGVLASMIVVQTPRGDAMFLAMCARSAAMIHDHRGYDFI